jgi:hypothetical protein
MRNGILLAFALAMVGCSPSPRDVALQRTKQTALQKIRERLTDPESARFTDVRIVTVHDARGIEQVTSVCGEVNSKNTFGGYAGPSPFIYTVQHKNPTKAYRTAWPSGTWFTYDPNHSECPHRAYTAFCGKDTAVRSADDMNALEVDLCWIRFRLAFEYLGPHRKDLVSDIGHDAEPQHAAHSRPENAALACAAPVNSI